MPAWLLGIVVGQAVILGLSAAGLLVVMHRFLRVEWPEFKTEVATDSTRLSTQMHRMSNALGKVETTVEHLGRRLDRLEDRSYVAAPR